jgi:hypothetical protein
MNRKIIFLLLIIIPTLIFGYPRQTDYVDRIPVFEGARADSAHGFDVIKYELYLDVDTAAHYIDGLINAEVIATADITQIAYELVGLAVESVSVNGENAAYSHSGGILTIELGDIANGEEFTTSVSYNGYPQNSPGYGGGMFWNNNYVFTVSDPDASRYWWPCYDHPWDKAIVDLHITLRDDWLVAANGIRSGIDNNGDGTNTTHWLGEHPMTTYLACFHAANFVEFEQECILPNGEDLLVQHFCPPNQLANAQTDFAFMPMMIEHFSELFGIYPFEKFGNCVVPMTIFAGMEHQTMVTLANFLITGAHTYDVIFAHELAHQWFGDCVAFLDFPHVWLSEGFATYSEALWMEEWQGYQAMLDYVASDIQGYYLNWSGGTNYTIYNPSFYNYFTPPVYEKAASVLHILRLYVGDEQFFEILQTYFATYMHGNAVTGEFRQIVEDVSGEDYAQFFSQWIYGSGIPSYEYAWFIAPDEESPVMRTYVKTLSTSSTDFFCKVPFTVTYTAGEESFLMDAEPDIAVTDRNIEDSDISAVEFDPDSWLLDRGVVHHRLEIMGVYPFEGGAALYWSPVWGEELIVDGYRLLRSESETGEFYAINQDLIEGTMYLDEGLQVGSTYYYKVQAVIEVEYESEPSEVIAVIIEEWPLDQGVLVIDETLDGNGNPGNPTDAMVDEFYASVTGLPVTHYDYAQEGAISSELIRNYSTVIWHDEDIGSKNIGDNEEVLGSYIYAGGNLLVSGWKTCTDLSAGFLEQFTGSGEYEMVSAQEFVGATSIIYDDMYLDGDKIPAAFNGRLPYITLFPSGDADIFAYAGITGSQYTGEPCAVRRNFSGSSIILGFPLYYFQEADVSTFMAAILAEFEGNSIDEEQIVESQVDLRIYPNPFYSGTRSGLQLNYELSGNLQGVLSIYNLRGQKLDELHLESGSNHYNWNYKREISSGIYFFRLESGSSRIAQKTLILK